MHKMLDSNRKDHLFVLLLRSKIDSIKNNLALNFDPDS